MERKSIKRASRDAAGWLLVAALFYSPWDYGGTGAAAIRNLNWILGAAFLVWLIGRLFGRSSKEERTGISDPGYNKAWVLLAVSGLLLLMGWGMALNAHSISDADYWISLPLTSPLPNAPGSVDYALSLAWMWRATALLGCVWVVADLAQDKKWLLRIWWAIGLAGGSIALLGLLQKATGAQMVFWEQLERGEPPVATFFATYYYHGNAGAFLNLSYPAILGLAWRYVTRRANPVARALWLTLALIMTVAVASDTSRMGQSIAVAMVLVLLAFSLGKVFRRVRHIEWKTALFALVAGGVALWAIVQTSQIDRSLGRWDRFQSTWTSDARWLVDRVAMDALPEAGAVGFGPGTFSVVFPHLQLEAPAGAQGSWLFLHNDYLQTLLEWGWVGGLLWGVVLFGGMGVALWSLMHRSRSANWLPRQRVLLALALVALGGVALHAVVDFPLQISSIQLYAATWLGVCWGAGRWPAESRK